MDFYSYFNFGMADFLFQDRFHQLSNWIVTAAFPSSNAWMHAIVHIVLLVMPVSFLLLLLVWCVRAIKHKVFSLSERNVQCIVAPFPANLLSYILNCTGRWQVFVIIYSLFSLPLFYVVLELPKQIVNKALNPEWEDVNFFGFEISQYQVLLVLCLSYLCAVLMSGALKYVIGLLQGRLIEAMMRRMRFAAFRAWSRSHAPHDHAQVIPVLVQEIEPIAGFIGDVFLVPVLQGGTFLTILAFMIIQDPR